MRKRKLIATTLLEVIVALSIVLILAAIATPIFARARRSAGDTFEISSLRQIGAAASLYAEEYGGYPDRAKTLVDAHFVPKELLTSAIDPTPEGIANRIPNELAARSTVYRDLPTSYRNSLIGLGDWALSSLSDTVDQNADGGFFVSLSDWEPPQGSYSNLTTDAPQPYFRLYKDGSAHRKFYVSIYVNLNNQTVHGDSPLFLYIDESDQWKQKFVTH